MAGTASSAPACVTSGEVGDLDASGEPPSLVTATVRAPAARAQASGLDDLLASRPDCDTATASTPVQVERGASYAVAIDGDARVASRPAADRAEVLPVTRPRCPTTRGR